MRHFLLTLIDLQLSNLVEKPFESLYKNIQQNLNFYLTKYIFKISVKITHETQLLHTKRKQDLRMGAHVGKG